MQNFQAGPMEIFGLLLDSPDNEGFGKRVLTVSEHKGAIQSAQGPATVAEYTFANCPPLDVLVIPGGIGTRTEVNNGTIRRFIQDFVIGMGTSPDRQLLSVCTGAALLAAAGILGGRQATTNKRAFSWVRNSRSTLSSPGGQSIKEILWKKECRFVVDGSIITAAGVSAGIDAALHMILLRYGKEKAENIASRAEYSGNYEDGSVDLFGSLAS